MDVPFQASQRHPPGSFVRMCSEKPTPDVGRWDTWERSKWTNLHTGSLGRIFEVVGHSDAFGIISVKAKGGTLIWLCCDWVTKATRNDLVENERREAKEEGDLQVIGADRRRDRNLSLAFTGTLKSSLWEPNDIVRVVDREHSCYTLKARIVRRDPDGTFTLNFAMSGRGVGADWEPSQLEYVKE